MKTNVPLIANLGFKGAQESLGMRVSFIAGVMVIAVSAAVITGVSLAISTLVMPAVYNLPDDQAVRTMQYITVHVVPPAFEIAVVGTGAYALSLVGIDLLTRGHKACVALLIGAVAYTLGVVGVTLLGHAPLDSSLLALDTAALPGDAWLRYATPWLGFNNLRALAAAVAAACFTIAMLRR